MAQLYILCLHGDWCNLNAVTKKDTFSLLIRPNRGTKLFYIGFGIQIAILQCIHACIDSQGKQHLSHKVDCMNFKS